MTTPKELPRAVWRRPQEVTTVVCCQNGCLTDERHWRPAAGFRGLPEALVNCDPPGRLEFWPRVLHSPVDVEKVRSTGFRLYSGGGRTYAINWGQGRAYYWRG